MSLFNLVTMTLKRTTPGAYVDGEYIYGTETITTFTGTFQPAPGEVTATDPGGRRQSNSDIIFTSTLLYPTVNKDSQPSDIIDYNGKTYEVKRVASWGNGILSHYEVEVQEQKEGAVR